MKVDLINQPLNRNQGLGLAPAIIAAIITSTVAAGAGIATSIINAKTQKKNNQAAKELAQMQLDAQKNQTAQSSAYMQLLQNQQPQTQTQTQDNTLLYVAIAGLALMLMMKK